MIGLILKHPRIAGVIGAGAVAAGLFFGARVYIDQVRADAFRDGKRACQTARLEADLAAARQAIVDTAASAGDALRQTARMGGAISRFAGELAADLSDLELPPGTFQKAKQESANAIADLPPDTDSCLDRVPDRRVCLARAEALGLDPELSCSPG